jgi:hypothetical protein
MEHHWEANVHYYDYTPETARRPPSMDAVVVAEAFIYDDADDTPPPVHVLVLAPGLALRGIGLAAAIETARKLLPDLIRRHSPEAKGRQTQINYTYNLSGQGPTVMEGV